MESVWDSLERHAAAAHRVLLRVTLRARAGQVAEELLHDLFLQLSRSPGFRNAANREAYMCRAAVNLATDWLRRQSRQREVTLAGEFAAPNRPVESAPENLEEVTRIMNAAVTLGNLMRQAFFLRFVQGLSYQQVGDVLGKTPHQSRGICHAALRAVREILNQPQNHEVTTPLNHQTEVDDA